MPRGFSESEMKRIEQSLVAIGMQRLATTGIHKTTVEDLTSAAGISKGAFYKFFPSKEVLFFNIIDIYEQQLEDKFFKLFPEPNNGNGINLKEIVNTMMFSEAMQDYISIMKTDDIEYLLRTIEPQIAEAHMGKDVAFMQSLIEKLSEYEISTAVEPDALLAYVSGLFCLFFERHIFRENHFIMVVDSYIDMLIRILLV